MRLQVVLAGQQCPSPAGQCSAVAVSAEISTPRPLWQKIIWTRTGEPVTCVSTWTNILCIEETFWTSFWMLVATTEAVLLNSSMILSSAMARTYVWWPNSSHDTNCLHKYWLRERRKFPGHWNIFCMQFLHAFMVITFTMRNCTWLIAVPAPHLISIIRTPPS